MNNEEFAAKFASCVADFAVSDEGGFAVKYTRTH